MHISQLIFALKYHKGELDMGLIPRILNLFKSFSPLISQINSFISVLGQVDRPLTCAEELALGDILFSDTSSPILDTDHAFIESLKASLFCSYLARSTDLKDRAERAATVYYNLKSLKKNPLLLQPKFFDLVKNIWNSRGTCDFLLSLSPENIEKLNDEILQLIILAQQTTPLVETLAKIAHKNLLTLPVISFLKKAQHDINETADAFIRLREHEFLNENTMGLLTTCRASVDDMSDVLIQIRKNATIGQEIDSFSLNISDALYHLISEWDKNMGGYSKAFTKLPMLIQNLKQADVYNGHTLNILADNICDTEALLHAFVKLKTENLFEEKYLEHLSHRQFPEDVAQVMVILSKDNLLDHNLAKIRTSCNIHQLPPYLEKLKEYGLLNQKSLDLILGRSDFNLMTELAIILGKANLMDEKTIDFLRKQSPASCADMSQQIIAVSKSVFITKPLLERILTKELSHFDMYALKRFGFTSNMNPKPEVVSQPVPQPDEMHEISLVM